MKKLISRFASKRILSYLFLVYRYHQKMKSIFKTFKFAFISLFKFYMPSTKKSKGQQIKKLLNKVKIKIDTNNVFIYNIDIYKSLNKKNTIIENLSIDYSIILEKSLNDFKNELNHLNDSDYKMNQLELLEGIELYINRLIKKIKNSSIKDKNKYILYFENIKNKKSSSFEESIQRILFYNSLLWQTGHALNGLGRLDKILDKYYINDLKKEILNKSEVEIMLTEMLNILHDNYWWKSNSLIGDTGQIIIIGGQNFDGSYLCNDLTYMFIEIIRKMKKPDPKILLRVSDNTPRDLIENALKCVQTGNGSPLFSNDMEIIPKLIKFGYDKKDAYNYVVSACWEPFIAGKSLDQNNIGIFVFMDPFLKMFEQEDLKQVNNYDKLLSIYKKYLKEYIVIN